MDAWLYPSGCVRGLATYPVLRLVRSGDEEDVRHLFSIVVILFFDGLLENVAVPEEENEVDSWDTDRVCNIGW